MQPGPLVEPIEGVERVDDDLVDALEVLVESHVAVQLCQPRVVRKDEPEVGDLHQIAHGAYRVHLGDAALLITGQGGEGRQGQLE
jgi:hypothetical protein